MTSIFDVSPHDGGWRLKIADTGEVLFFPARRRAITQAKALARAWPQPVAVKVQARRAQSRESWPEGTSAFPYPLGAPA